MQTTYGQPEANLLVLFGVGFILAAVLLRRLLHRMIQSRPIEKPDPQR